MRDWFSRDLNEDFCTWQQSKVERLHSSLCIQGREKSLMQSLWNYFSCLYILLRKYLNWNVSFKSLSTYYQMPVLWKFRKFLYSVGYICIAPWMKTWVVTVNSDMCGLISSDLPPCINASIIHIGFLKVSENMSNFREK